MTNVESVHSRQDFFELAYAAIYPDVAAAIKAKAFQSCRHHFNEYGQFEHRLSQEDVDCIVEGIDFDWYRGEYACEGNKLAVFSHYLTYSAKAEHSPNRNFSESAFIADNDLGSHKRHNGYITFLMDEDKSKYVVLTCEEEKIKRQRADARKKIERLEQFASGITALQGVKRIDEFKDKIDPPVTIRRSDLPKRLNIVVPHLAPEIYFGGYSALMQLCLWLQKNGVRLRFIVTEQASRSNLEHIRTSFRNIEPVFTVLKNSDVQFVSHGATLEIGKLDDVLCYSMWTAFLGKKMTDLTDGKLFYFIQEYEPLFHPSGPHAFIGASVLNWKHIPIFNSEELAAYFRTNRIGIFKDSTENMPPTHFVFRHVIPEVRLPDVGALRSRLSRKLLFYARPEQHAERNIFEVGVLALERAIQQKIFGPEWEFHGIGSLGSYYEIDLPDRRQLKCIPKAPANDYYEYLTQFDVGMSFIYAPHPGVVHFEMAAAGLPTVTNIYQNRSAAYLRSISGNLIGCECDIDSVVQGLKLAVERTDRYDERRQAAGLPYPRSWPESFDSLRGALALLKEGA